ncbi:hypothetical protein [Rothia nasimurium]|uniref:YncE family protein n=1 Tax=Rothia nasimurium TaxID=85336 RepID=UPI002DD62376|nr:hypothetical protein [Rothia nasimurium]
MTIPASPKTKRFAAVAGTAAILASGFTAVPAAFAAETADSTGDACMYRPVSVTATQTQGLPGQYMGGYSAKNNVLWATSSSGRPPIMTSTLAKIDPATMQVLNTVGLNTADYSPRGWDQETPAGKQVAGAYGVGVDDVNNLVWVTNTRTNSVTAFDQTTMKKVFSTLDQPEGERVEIPHPREVRIANGKVFVGVQGGLVVFDAATQDYITTVAFSEADGRKTSVMNFALDEANGLGYFPTFGTNQLTVVDLNTLQIKTDITVTLQGNDDTVGLVPSDVTFDNSLNELYVSSQGTDGKNAGVGIYDKTTGAFKKFIDFGTQGLAITSDEDQDLVYATDYKTGAYYVIDGRTHNIAATVNRTQGDGMGGNDVIVTPHGVFGLGRSSVYENVEVPFTLDYKTGQYKTSSTEIKGLVNKAEQGQPANWVEADPTPINANVITKFTAVAGEAVAVAPTVGDEVINSFEGEAKDGAKLVITNVTEGGTMTLTGTGFKHPDGTGSVLGVLLDDRGTSYKDQEGGVSATIEADADGNFSVTLPVPTAENANQAWVEGSAHRVRVLSGSLKDGDTARTLPIEVTVAAAPAGSCEAPTSVSVDPTLVAFQGYGTFVDSATGLDIVEPTPAPTEPVVPAPTEPIVPAPTAEPTSSAAPTAAPSSAPSADASESAAPSASADDKGSKDAAPSASASSSDAAVANNGGSTGSSNATSGKKSLAHTGASVAALLGVGAAALAIGGVMVARRRQA